MKHLLSDFYAAMEQKTFIGRVKHHPHSRRKLAIASIVGAVLLLSLSDSIVKLANDRFALGQLFLVRSSIATILIFGGVVLLSDRTTLRPIRPAWVWGRSLCLTTMWLCYYAALPSMSFALAAAGYYTSPLWMAVLSRVILKESVGPLRWVAITIGFLGVILVLRPSAESFSPIFVLPLAAAVCYALAAIVTWSRCTEEAPFALAFNLNITMALGGAIGVFMLALFSPEGGHDFVLSVWPTLTFADWMLLGLLAAFLAIITAVVAQAYQLAPSPVVGVFDNAYLVFAVLWSALLFSDPPSLLESVGIVLIGLGAFLTSIPERPGTKLRSKPQ